jgi:hypothetical protein
MDDEIARKLSLGTTIWDFRTSMNVCSHLILISQLQLTSSIWIGDNGLAVFTFNDFTAVLADRYQDDLCPLITAYLRT